MKILRICRTPARVEVFALDGERKTKIFFYDTTKTNSEIVSELTGESVPETPVNTTANVPETPQKTVPEPVPFARQRVSREEMINALRAAGVTDYDASKFLSLKSRYDRFIKEGK